MIYLMPKKLTDQVNSWARMCGFQLFMLFYLVVEGIRMAEREMLLLAKPEMQIKNKFLFFFKVG